MDFITDIINSSFIFSFTSAAFLTLGLIFTLSYWNFKFNNINKIFGLMSLNGGVYYLTYGIFMQFEESNSVLIITSLGFAAIYLGILPWFLAYYSKYIFKWILYTLSGLVLLSYILFVLYFNTPKHVYHHVIVPTQIAIFLYGILGSRKMYQLSQKRESLTFLLANLIGLIGAITYGIGSYFHYYSLIWIYDIYPLFFIGIMGIRMILNNQKSIRTEEKLFKKNLENQKLIELDKIKTNLFSNISHEFRTPLTLILNPLKSVLPKIENKEVKQEMNLVLRNANKLLQLINQILDLSKLKGGKMKKATTVGGLSKSIKIIVSSFDSLADNLFIGFQKQYGSSNLITNFNKDHLEKIINNLLSNAFKFTPKGGKVKFTFELLDKNGEVFHTDKNDIKELASYRFSIIDTGKGIEEENLPKIFDRFYQADNSSIRSFEGTGIGLSLVKELTELHGGSIHVKSEIGWGTEVFVQLPLDEVYSVKNENKILNSDSIKKENLNNLIPIEKDYKASDNISKTSKEKDKNIILIIEDNDDLRSYIHKIVKNDYHILEATNGKEGMKIALNEVPDLIISDVMMPKMDGFELVKKLKNDQKTSHIPIILLTALSSKENKLSGLKLGVDEYLAKPFDEEELIVRIQNLIQIRSNLHNLFKSENFITPNKHIPTKESEFLKRSVEVVEDNMGNDQFSVEDLSSELGMSRVQYHRKIKAITNHSTTYFIRSIRLEKAKELLQNDNYNVTEVAYMVGFNSQSYFTKSFLKHFDIPPSAFGKN